MARNVKKQIQKHKEVSYTNRDFNSFKNELNRYISTHFNKNIVDISDASLAGMFVDVAAYVGDVMSYYIDHQFNETSIETAVEEENIERFIRESGLEIPAASPAVAEVSFRIRVPATIIDGEYQPNKIYLPVIKKNTIVASTSVNFYLLEDIDFSKTNTEGKLVASVRIGQLDGDIPLNFIVERKGLCTSARISQETFAIDNDLIPFRTISLSEPDINEVISVTDSSGDKYYEVESLTQDTVFLRHANNRSDVEDVAERINLFHAPKRFIKERSTITGLTTLRFGAGDETKFDEDIIPDPSDHAIKLFGDRESTRKINIDPNSFLATQTLGISPRNTALTIRYRHGGGLSHNVFVGEISSVRTLLTNFNVATPTSIMTSIRASTEVINETPAAGGEDEPSLEELRTIAILNRNSQNRIVTREDLIARVYSLPTKFGRVFRVSVRDNPNNPQAAQLHIISRDSNGDLMLSPDTLKQNLSTYLSKFRLVSDAVDILDASIINFGINYSVTVDTDVDSDGVINTINARLIEYFDIKKWQIDQPIVIGELENLILNTFGVITIVEFNVTGKSNEVDGLEYSDLSFNVNRYMDRGYIFPPRGGMFELKYPNQDLVGRIS